MTQTVDASTRKVLEKGPWFHSIDFGDQVGFVSRSRFSPTVPPNHTLFGFYEFITHVDLKGAACLDIGTMDGISAFIMKKLGAETVTATDVAARATFSAGSRALGLDIEYITGVELANIATKLNQRTFDLVLMAGVLYHVFDPLTAIATVRSLTKTDGLAVIETHFLPGEERPVMIFNPSDPDGAAQPNFFWRASLSCLEGMFQLCCFEVVSRIDIGKRVSYLLRARKPSQMNDASDVMKGIYDKFQHFYRNYKESMDFRAAESSEQLSKISLKSSPEPQRSIRVGSYVPRVPLQPKWTRPVTQAKEVSAKQAPAKAVSPEGMPLETASLETASPKAVSPETASTKTASTKTASTKIEQSS